LLFGKKL
jgi:hypothetical protein